LIAIFIFTSFYIFFAQAQSQIIVFCNVGQGDGILIKDGLEEIVIDSGPKNSRMLQCLQKYLPFFDRKIEKIIASHYDADHLAGFLEIIDYYEVGEIYGLGGKMRETEIALEWRDKIQKLGKTEQTLVYGMRLGTDNSELEVIYPFLNSNYAEKNTSLVSLVQFLDKRFLLTGDLEIMSWQEVFSKYLNIEADILKISHHGSKNGTSSKLLEKVRPNEAVISVGKNSYGHPHKEVLDLLNDKNIKIRRTDIENDIIYR